MKAKTGSREKGDFKGGFSDSGTIAPESRDEALATLAKRCTGHVSRRTAGRSAASEALARKMTVELPADEFDLVAKAAAAKGITVQQFIVEAVQEMIGAAPATEEGKGLIDTGLLPADAPLSEWEILLDEAANPFRVVKVFKKTLRAYPWGEDPRHQPASVTFTHDQARAMRRAGIPKALTVGDVLVWGDKPCRVTRLPSSEEMTNGTRENPPTMTLAGDWLEAGELFDEEVPYSSAALHVRFLRFAMPAEREAFEEAGQIHTGFTLPSEAERRAVKKGHHEDQPARDGK